MSERNKLIDQLKEEHKKELFFGCVRFVGRQIGPELLPELTKQVNVTTLNFMERKSKQFLKEKNLLGLQILNEVLAREVDLGKVLAQNIGKRFL